MATDFGKELKRLRLQAGYGLRRFAELADLKPSNLSAIEHGRRLPPTDTNRLKELADALGLVEKTSDWEAFFDAARREGDLPADVRHVADRELVPVLLRTIDNSNLSDEQITELIDDIRECSGKVGGKNGTDSAVQRKRD